jgi:uncharacterized membrane protein YbaN (DUF454 family)
MTGADDTEPLSGAHADAPEAKAPTGRIARAGWLALGLFCVALGIVGAVLPLMPTTIFLILAAGCFARSSARLEARLLAHPRFGPAIRNWRAERAIPRGAKRAACIGIAAGYGMFWLAVRPGWLLGLAAAAAMAACALWIVSRPLPGADSRTGI